jgi:paraquat-inducible protein A
MSALPAWKQRAIPSLLVFAFLLFGAGIFFPFFSVTKLWVFEDGVSIFSGIMTLFHEGEYFLFGLLTLFTLVFPCAKLGLLAIIWAERKHDLEKVRRLHHRVEALGKWSMLDVFVLAVLIVVAKSAAVAKVQTGAGVYLFTFSVIFTQCAAGWISRQIRPAALTGEPVEESPESTLD